MTKIAFASCSKIQKQKVQPAWKAIENEAPNHLLLLGDNVYSPLLTWNHKKLEKRYKQQFQEENFRSLIQKVPFNAIWDDHDLGPNDVKGAHVSEERKAKSLELFHRYMNCSNNLPHVYHSFVIGNIKIIMLDGRFYREKAHKRKNATIFGVEQEQWFENELNHPHEFTIVCCGSCLKSGNEKLESYDDYFPKLMSLLRKNKKTLFLSGDIHENGFTDHDGFFEATSSGVGRMDLNNYGVVTFSDEKVVINLRGRRERDNRNIVIDSSSWKVASIA